MRNFVKQVASLKGARAKRLTAARVEKEKNKSKKVRKKVIKRGTVNFRSARNARTGAGP